MGRTLSSQCADFFGLGTAAWVAQLGNEAFELAALHPDRAADLDHSEPMPSNLTLEAAAGAAQLALGLIEGEQHRVGCGRGGDADVWSGLHVAPRDDQPP